MNEKRDLRDTTPAKYQAPGGVSHDGTMWIISNRRLFLDWKDVTSHLDLDEALKVTDPYTRYNAYGYTRDGVTTITDQAKYQEHLAAMKSEEERQRERQRVERERIEMETDQVREVLAQRGVVLEFEYDCQDVYVTVLVDGVMIAKEISPW